MHSAEQHEFIDVPAFPSMPSIRGLYLHAKSIALELDVAMMKTAEAIGIAYEKQNAPQASTSNRKILYCSVCLGEILKEECTSHRAILWKGSPCHDLCASFWSNRVSSKPPPSV